MIFNCPLSIDDCQAGSELFTAENAESVENGKACYVSRYGRDILTAEHAESAENGKAYYVSCYARDMLTAEHAENAENGKAYYVSRYGREILTAEHAENAENRRACYVSRYGRFGVSDYIEVISAIPAASAVITSTAGATDFLTAEHAESAENGKACYVSRYTRFGVSDYIEITSAIAAASAVKREQIRAISAISGLTEF